MKMARPRSGSFMRDEAPLLKERMYSTWYRVRYGWQFRSSIEIGRTPIWILGHCYHSESTGDTTSSATASSSSSRDSEGVPPHVLAFMEHYHSLPWMTYRANFPTIENTGFSTDCGWGCMVRSGQMILATVLGYFLLGIDWRLTTCSPKEKDLHKHIIAWFSDHPSERCPFSLHALMRQAVLQGYRPGDWFGPSQVAILIRDTVAEAQKILPSLRALMVYVAHDCTVYLGDVNKMFAEHPDRALFLLVPVRLGSEALNPIYIPCVKALLGLDHCVGIIGGRPKHSVYFVGFQDDKLLHLDPHYCQNYVDTTLDDYDLKSYHCSTPRKLPASKMDPSCTIGFFCTSQEDFQKLREQAEKVLAPPLQRGVYPFFTFCEQSQEDALDKSVRMQLGSLTSGRYDGSRNGVEAVDGGGRGKGGVVDDEDFVVVDCSERTTRLPS